MIFHRYPSAESMADLPTRSRHRDLISTTRVSPFPLLLGSSQRLLERVSTEFGFSFVHASRHFAIHSSRVIERPACAPGRHGGITSTPFRSVHRLSSPQPLLFPLHPSISRSFSSAIRILFLSRSPSLPPRGIQTDRPIKVHLARISLAGIPREYRYALARLDGR